MNKSIFGVTTLFLVVGVIIIGFQNIKKSSFPVEPVSNASFSTAIASTTLLLWGKNDDGQLGISPNTRLSEKDSVEAKKNIPIRATITSLSVGKSHTLALDTDGHVWSWGQNHFGQLGRPITTEYDPQPAIIPGLDHVRSIITEKDHSLALKEDGTVWSWGYNFSGQLGDGTRRATSTPQQVKGLSNVVGIATGYKFSFAVLKDGSVMGWGANCTEATRKESVDLLEGFSASLTAVTGGYYDPNSTADTGYNPAHDCLHEAVIGLSSLTPIKIKTLSDVKSLSAGYGHLLILKNDGTLWSLGCNLYGQLGQGHFNNVMENSVPKQVVIPGKVISMSAGFRHSSAITEDGKLYGWGVSADITAQKDVHNGSTPSLVGQVSDAITVDDGFDMTIFTRKDGSFWGFGADVFGLITSKQREFYYEPVPITRIPGAKLIFLGIAHAAALTK